MSGDWNRRIGYRIYNITYKSHQSTERQTFTCQMPRNPFHIEGQPNFRSLQVLEGQCEFKSFNVSWKHVRSTGPDAYCYAVFNAIKRPSCLSSQSRIPKKGLEPNLRQLMMFGMNIITHPTSAKL